MSATTAPLTDALSLLLDRLRASKAGHFVAPRPSELSPRPSRPAAVPTDHRQLYHALPTRWGVDEGYAPPSRRPGAPSVQTREEHRRASEPASSRMADSGSFRLFD